MFRRYVVVFGYGSVRIEVEVKRPEVEEDREDGLDWSAEGIAKREKEDRQTDRQTGC